MTDTADAAATARQCVELAEAGSEMVRVTVNTPEAAAGRARRSSSACSTPAARRRSSATSTTTATCCSRDSRTPRARSTSTASIPGNVGTGKRRDEQFSTICKVAVEHQKPVRIGVNGGSLNQELVMAKMQENTDRQLGQSSEEIINECMVLSALAVDGARARSGPAQATDHHLVQGLAAARSDRRLSRPREARPTSRCTSA